MEDEPKTMRSISFVDKATLNFNGNVMQNALCLGDVDNDGVNELIVGNYVGDIAIFKDVNSSNPWMRCEKTEPITALVVGDLLNSGKNVLVAVSGDGWCYLFDMSDQIERFDSPLIVAENVSLSPRKESERLSQEKSEILKAEMKKDAKVNNQTSDEKIDSTDNPKLSEEVATLNLSDLSTHKSFHENVKNIETKSSNALKVTYKQRIPSNVKEILVFDIDNDGQNELVIALTDRVVRTYRWGETTFQEEKSPRVGLIPVNKWEFGEQVGTITRHRNADGTNALIISQPGGSLLKLKCRSINDGGTEALADLPPEEALKAIGDLDYEPLLIEQMRNINVTSEIKGNFKTPLVDEEEGSSPYVVSTLDGAIMFVKDEQVIWTINTNKQLICLRKLCIGPMESDVVIVTSWSGNTYFVSQSGDAMEYIFADSIATFTCDTFSVNGEVKPVLVYVTFEGEIGVYYNIKFLTAAMENLIDLDVDEEFAGLAKETTLFEKMETAADLAELNRYLFYSLPALLREKEQTLKQ